MKRARLIFLFVLWLVAALVLAFPLRETARQMVVMPLAYLWWILGLVYRSIPQPFVWVFVVVAMIYLALGSFFRSGLPRRAPPVRAVEQRGPVAEMARILSHKGEGVYFKWQVARTLSEIAMDLQELRTHTKPTNLEVDTSAAPPAVQRYLDAGLHTSFSYYPLPGPFQPRLQTPFDAELGPVLDYLESQTEMDDAVRPS